MTYSILVYRDRDGRWSARAEGETYGAYALSMQHRISAAQLALGLVEQAEKSVSIPSRTRSRFEAARVGGLYRVRDGEEASDA